MLNFQEHLKINIFNENFMFKKKFQKNSKKQPKKSENFIQKNNEIIFLKSIF